MTDFAKKYDWWDDAARLRVGLLKRPQPQVPHMTRPRWNRELNELNGFAAWLTWRYGNKKGAPPAWRPAKKTWAWQVYSEYLKAHPKPPPTGPPPPPNPGDQPPSRWKGAPWTKRHFHVAYGLRENDGVWTIPQLVARATRYGAGAIFMQLGDDGNDPDWARHTRELYAAGKAVGLQIGAWGRADYAPWDQVKADIRSVMPLDGYLADVEQRVNDQKLPEHLRDEFGKDMPLGVIATGGIDESLDEDSVQAVAARWGDWFDFVGQDYHKVSLPLTPDAGESFAYWRGTAKCNGRGFRHLPDANNRWHIPVVMPNAETCPPLSAHVDWLKPYSPHFGVWDGELLEEYSEWDVYASI